MNLNKVIVIYMKPKFPIEKETIELVCRVLKQHNIQFTKIERTKDYKNILKDHDLIIIIGGDGTFLLTSQFVKDTPMLGVNSNPDMKEGFLMQTAKYDFKQKFMDLLQDKHKIVFLTRLQPVLNGKILRPALNEIFIGHKKPYKMTRYTLIINNKGEFQRSSGIIFATAIGSHAWAASAGGKKMLLLSKNYQFVVREPYQGTLHTHHLLKGILTKKDKVEIVAKMGNGIISIDALSEDFPFKKGSTLKVEIAKTPLPYIVFSDFDYEC
ncbi:NAD(+)/NADH kinase [Candidatus Woesearchaeota archaeon]|nr:NAD(+)/NADH kinase [Candidatus Woesearchaeota archaeon]